MDYDVYYKDGNHKMFNAPNIIALMAFLIKDKNNDSITLIKEKSS